MSKNDPKPDDRAERLAAEVHAGLSRAGWRVPQTLEEVKGAERWMEQSGPTLPARLRETPEPAASPEAKGPGSGLLARYMDPEPGHRPGAEGGKAMEEDRGGPDLER